MGTTFLAVLLGLCSAPSLDPAPTPAPEEPAPIPSITAVGSGEVTAMPDTAEVRLCLETEAYSASSALRDNAAAVEGLRRKLRERGIARKDVQTVPSRVVPLFTNVGSPPAQPELACYLARTQVRIKVRRLDRLGKVLDDAAGEGAQMVREVAYAVADPAPLLAQARRRALADARRRAEAYAHEAGMELGEILHIEEQKPDRDEMPATDQDQPDPDAEQAFRASVAVTYALYPKPTGRKLESKERR
jgi:uncharacterized protein